MTICVGGVEIKKVNVAKSLGLMIDDTLSWSAQIDKITKKVNSDSKHYKKIARYS